MKNRESIVILILIPQTKSALDPPGLNMSSKFEESVLDQLKI